jgi:hypothetical protein
MKRVCAQDGAQMGCGSMWRNFGKSIVGMQLQQVANGFKAGDESAGRVALKREGLP